MKSIPIALITAIIFLAPSFSLAQGKVGGNRSGSVPQGGVLGSGPLPDLNAFTADGKPIKLPELCQGG